MKKLLFLSALLIFACSSGGDSDNNEIGNLEYLGTYRGNIDVFLNGTYHSTLNDHQMTFVSIQNSNQVNIIGNLIMTSNCTFDQDGFVIPETIPVTTEFFYALEYGSGILNGNSLEIELYQDQINSTTGNVQGTGFWTGTLEKI
tara:strand:+ start:1327 stop:1758 length:432 start_codon:yes stop_codon:yes gene_type:complete